MKKKRIILIIGLILIGIIIWIIWGNKALQITNYDVYSNKVMADDEIIVVQISDLHNETFGDDQEDLLKKITEVSPDLIAITGDLIDKRHPDVDAAMEFVKGALDLAPVYYVTGNHEAKTLENYQILKDKMQGLGVNVLEDSEKEITIKNTKLTIVGLNDPMFAHEPSVYDGTIISHKLESIEYNKENFVLLLAHRPELFKTYTNYEVDLVLSGHAHGGQVRLPLIGGVLSPGQGFFPKYSEGVFTENNTQMIVSRGIGNSVFPFRVNNRPEIVVVRLKRK